MFIQVLCVSLFAFIFGAALLFLGYRFFFLLLPFWGFFAGFGLGAGMITLFLGDGFLGTVTGWASGFIFGLIFAALSYLFYFVGIALVAGSVGYGLGAGLVYLIFPNSFGIMAFLVGMVGAAIVALITLAFNLQKYVVIAITASAGATALMTSLFLILGTVSLSDLEANPVQPILQDSPFWALLWFVLLGVGLVAQIQSTRSYILVEPEGQRAW